MNSNCIVKYANKNPTDLKSSKMPVKEYILFAPPELTDALFGRNYVYEHLTHYLNDIGMKNISKNLKESSSYYTVSVDIVRDSFGTPGQSIISSLGALNLFAVLPLWTTISYHLNIQKIVNGRLVKKYSYFNSWEEFQSMFLMFFGFLIPGTNWESMNNPYNRSDFLEGKILKGLIADFAKETSSDEK